MTEVIPVLSRGAYIRRPVAGEGDVLEKKGMTKVRLAARFAALTLSAAIVVALVLPVLRVAASIVT